MRSTLLLALAASTNAVYQGFNYGSTKSDGTTVRYQADFQALFQTAKNLVGTSGFTSARLYSMIQGGSSTNEPTQAIPAAIAEDTSLLLGLWASGGEGGIEAEITALTSAINQWGTKFTSLVAGISVGSEDLYRISPTGIAAKSGYGADPATVASYIAKVRAAIAGTSLSGAPIGHVDTWTAWVNGSNQAVVDACDWIGMDAYPYFQNTQSNGIESAKGLFNDALDATQAAVGGKPVWVTETGWPYSGSTENLAVPSTDNAKTYWDEVGCALFGTTNTWWYTIEDTDAAQTNPSFGVAPGNPLSTTPYYDLSCKAVSSSTSSSSVAASSTSSTAVESSTSSAASVASSAASSVSSAASGGSVASSGSGLSPSEGAGNGIGSASGTGAAPTTATPTTSSSVVSGGNGTTSATGTGGPTTTSKPTSSPSGTSSGALTQSTNAANYLSGSFAAIGALVVAAAAL